MNNFTGLYLCDYRYENVSSDSSRISIPRIADIPMEDLTRNLEPYYISNKIENASHVIGHFGIINFIDSEEKVDQFKSLLQGDSFPNCSNFQIILSVTRDYQSVYKSYKIEKDGKTRYIFIVNNKKFLYQEDVRKAFFEMDKHQAEELYNESLENISSKVLSLFVFPPKLLNTISVLCQGYLITNASFLSERELNIIISMISIDLSELLNNLKFHDADLNDKISYVREASWWRKCLGDDYNHIRCKIKREWESCESNCSGLTELLSVIYQPHKDEYISPELVCNTYHAICKHLE